jgi:hypothetical protein
VQSVEVEVLATETCASRRDVVEAVRRAASEAGVHVAVSEKVVTTQAEAEALRMPGSPTVRIGGRDVEPDAEAVQDFGLG